MANPLLAINYTAEAAIPINRIVKAGATDRGVTLAIAPADFIIGVVNETPIAIAERADVVRVGIAWVEAGAAIARGAPLTSDAIGRAVTAAPAAGANVRLVGFADEAATAAGDVIRFILAPGLMQG
jgi:Uncharacterized conserved protein (DUF2190)